MAKKLECHCSDIGIPQDVIDQAEKVGMDVKDLAQLCVCHTIDAARDFLTWLVDKFPSTSSPVK